MSLFTELKRRNVFRMGILYVISSWLVLQVGDVLFELLGVPDWGLKLVFGILLLGLPFALFFSWAYELTPEGLKRDAEVAPEHSIAPQTGKRLDRLIILVLAGVIVALLGERFVGPSSDPAEGGVEGDKAASRSLPGSVSAELDLSIAVLPFDNMSADANNEYFADGIAEEILNLLAGVGELEVASRTSSFAFKGKDTSIPDIASELKVRYVLEGSVRKAGSQVRITAQLIDASTDRHLWSDTFDRTLEDIFAVQDEIAGAIGEALQVRLLGSGGELVVSESIDPQMYEQFLEARFLMRRRSFDSIELAIRTLESVVEAEPEFTRGLILLAEALLLSVIDVDDDIRQIRVNKAQSLANAALAAEPNLAGGFMLLGWLAESPLARIRNLVRAVELDSKEPRPHHWLARELSFSGHLERAMAEINEAVRLEPSNANAHGWRSTLHAAMGNLEEAVDDALLQAELGNPTVGHNQAALYHVMDNDFQSAEDEFNKSISTSDSRTELMVALKQAVGGQEADRNGLLDIINAGTRFQSLVFAEMLVLGMHDEFLDFRLNNLRHNLGPSLIWHANQQSMRADARFIQLAEESGTADVWREIGPPPDCRAEGDSFVCGLGGEL